MAFEPFGYPFEIRSNLTPEEAKASIRRKKQSWFDSISGPRGWIIGPFLCLWMSAFDRTGPMLIGLLQRDDRGSRVRGRAGSDLNGIAYLAFMGAILLFAAIQMIRQGDLAVEKLGLYFGLPIAGILALVLWWAHKDRTQAEPLVHFLNQTLGRPAPPQPLRRRELQVRGLPASLIIDDDKTISAPAAKDIYDFVEGLLARRCEFGVLKRSEEEFMQTACSAGRLAIELRKGDARHHFHAVTTDGQENQWIDKQTVADTLLSYLEGREREARVIWKPGFARLS